MASAATAALAAARGKSAQDPPSDTTIADLVAAVAAAESSSTADAACAAALSGTAIECLSAGAKLLRFEMSLALLTCSQLRVELYQAEGRGDVQAAVDEARRGIALASDCQERRHGWLRMAAALATCRLYPAALRAATRVCQLDEQNFAAEQKAAEATNDVLELVADTLVAAVRQPELGLTAGLRVDEMSCAQCLAIVHQPVTLGDGVTVCKPCVPKYRRTASAQPPSHAACKLFGSNVNVLLHSTVQRVLPEAVAAAQARHEGNDHFRAKRWPEAINCYTRGIELGYDCHVLYANRSAAHLSAGAAAEAKADADAAIFAKPGWPRGFFRRGRALLAVDADELAHADGDSRLERLLEAVGDLSLAMGMGEEQGARAALVVALRRLIDHIVGKNGPDAYDQMDLDVSNPSSVEDLKEATIERIITQNIVSLGHAAAEAAKAGRQRRLPAKEVVSLRSDLECALCCDLLCDPSTLPCGHTLCRTCVWRNLDHAFESPPLCPLCRLDLSPFLVYLNKAARTQSARNGDGFAMGSGQICPTRILQELLEENFPDEVAARHKQAAEEEAVAGAQLADGGGTLLPIFVCSLAYPMQPCPLHIFEPRYRLMMRRTIESGQRRFGMVLPCRGSAGQDTGLPCMSCGTVLLIEHFEQQPDGRAHIETRGERRFRILEASQKDGYLVARVAWLDDERQTFREHLNAWGREESDAAQRARCGMAALAPLAPARAAQVQLWASELKSLVDYARAANQPREATDVATNESEEFQRWPSPHDPHHMIYFLLQVIYTFEWTGKSLSNCPASCAQQHS